MPITIMQQTSISSFFRNRKRSACEFIPSPGKLITKKILALDDGSLSPIRSSGARHLPTESNVVQKSLESSVNNGRTHFEKVERPISAPSPAIEKNSKEVHNTPPFKPVLEEFKKTVRNSKKYPILKAALKKYSTTVSHLEKLRHTGYDVQSSRSAAPLGKLMNERFAFTEPCFVRFQYLTAVVSPDELVLPPKYLTLEDVFNGVETAFRTSMNTQEIVTFKLIHNDVQMLTQRKFTEQHLGMIKTVYPDAYKLRYELVKLPFSHHDKFFELIIEKPKSNFSNDDERKKVFHELLLERTKRHHQEFLKTLDPPLVLSVDQIKRWHPLFDLNSVPDISPTLIPRPLCNSPASVLKENFEETVVSENQIESNINSVNSLRKALSCVPKSILMKIRANRVAKTRV